MCCICIEVCLEVARGAGGSSPGDGGISLQQPEAGLTRGSPVSLRCGLALSSSTSPGRVGMLMLSCHYLPLIFRLGASAWLEPVGSEWERKQMNNFSFIMDLCMTLVLEAGLGCSAGFPEFY